MRRRLVASVLACTLIIALTCDGVLPPEVGDCDPALVSVADRDGDGVPDGIDILAAARAYMGTHPRYQSAYVAGGRPTDGSGVCADVVDRALLGAGYDLKALVDEDVRAYPENYPEIAVPDSNIDFRRVGNLRVFFGRHATHLTLDVSDLSAWQPGDIVCWENHIGIVSDVRDPHGIPLVVHHAGLVQVSYEEDVLTSSVFGRLCGHWRMGVAPEVVTQHRIDSD